MRSVVVAIGALPMFTKSSAERLQPAVDFSAVRRRPSGMSIAMQRSGIAVLLALVVVTGLLGRAVVVRHQMPAGSSSDIVSHQTVDSFYAAMNTALSGGSTASLEALLSPIFVDHDAATAEELSAEAFLAGVRSAGASLQRMRFEVVSVDPDGENLEVAVRLVHGDAVEVAGMTIEQSLPEPHTELLRIERGKIVDRWAPDYPWLGVFAPAGPMPNISSTIGFTTLLTRVDLVGAEERTWKSSGIGIVMVSAGSVSLSISDEYGAQSIVVVEAGAFASIPGGTRARLRAVDGGAVSLMIFQATRIMGASEVITPDGTDVAARGGSSSVLWRGPLYWPGSDITHSAIRIELSARSDIRVSRRKVRCC